MANPNPLVPHQNHAVDFKLENLLSRTWENGMTGQKSIDKMREIIANKGVTIDRESVPEDWEDALLLRFFIGFKKNPQTAAEAVIEMLDWRAKNNINEIRRKIIGGLQPEQFPRYETVRRFYPLLKTGTDTNGSPIMITLTGLIDPAKLVKVKLQLDGAGTDLPSTGCHSGRNPPLHHLRDGTQAYQAVAVDGRDWDHVPRVGDP
eukprot:767235-Hanusia_phi.AAC.2